MRVCFRFGGGEWYGSVGTETDLILALIVSCCKLEASAPCPVRLQSLEENKHVSIEFVVLLIHHHFVRFVTEVSVSLSQN